MKRKIAQKQLYLLFNIDELSSISKMIQYLNFLYQFEISVKTVTKFGEFQFGVKLQNISKGQQKFRPIEQIERFFKDNLIEKKGKIEREVLAEIGFERGR